MKVHVERPTLYYNERRYGKPYIAEMDFGTNHQGEPRWGKWIGSPGEGGLLVLDTEIGAIVMQGQKDFRNRRKSAPSYFQVSSDGSLISLAGKAAAFKAYREAHSHHDQG